MRRSSLANHQTIRLGCETPRIYTQPLRPLTPQTSHGFACIRFAENMLGLRLMPWQKWLLIHALELLENGLYRFRTVLVLVARQNGKTLVMKILALWNLYVRGAKMVIASAQNLGKAEEAWREAVEMAESVPELLVEIDDVVQRMNHKALVLVSKERYEPVASNRRGARGKSGDLVLLDELREHHNWESWAAATKSTLARPKSQVWCFSNAGDAMAIVLRYLRALAHQALGWPDGDADATALEVGDDEDDENVFGDDEADSLGIFEWSMEPGKPRGDRDGWAQANPSMNHTDIVEDVITERAISAAMRTDPRHVFEVEVLCRWLSTIDGGPYPPNAWAAGTDNTSSIAEGSPIAACVDVSWDRSMAYVAFCGQRPDGLRHVEIVAMRAGTDWVIPWLRERADVFDVLTLQATGAPVSSLLEALMAETDDDGSPLFPIVKWEGTELGRASGAFYDKVSHRAVGDDETSSFAPLLFHTAQPVLDVAATSAAIKQAGDAWMIDRRKSSMDAAPLVAANGADWALDQIPEPEPESAYADPDWELTVL
ncbi:terminase large subunit [Rhodococcus sp. MEB041]|uniref:terminase large subunit domain-containing protein n=1 Tax=Rhodococcus sp. MEB041 TaxID=3040323 RepID=UPI00254A0EBC|nr:terminase large subunit [Rhodococcus sp. MEB041]